VDVVHVVAGGIISGEDGVDVVVVAGGIISGEDGIDAVAAAGGGTCRSRRRGCGC
jgi:hypothetical protein